MSGRLIILPKKKWNVWNSDNVERVLRDERLHREEVERVNERSSKVEKEFLVEQLQKRCAKADGRSESEPEATQHINLFEEEERGVGVEDNPDHLKEKQEFERRKQRREGIAPLSLGDTVKSKGKQWYEFSSLEAAPKRSVYGRPLDAESADRRAKKEEQFKAIFDPMSDVKKHFDRMAKDSRPDREGGRGKRKQRDGEERGERAGRRKRRRKSGEKKESTMDRLRRERHEREEEDRRKLRRLRGGRQQSTQEAVSSDLERPYHSQYHPEIAGRGKKYR